MRTKAKREKRPILRWRGLMAGKGRRERVMMFSYLLVIVVTLGFTSKGLMQIMMSQDDDAYVALSLIPIAVAGVTLGTASSLVMGLFSGAVLVLHATFQPLSYYETIAVTPESTLYIFGLGGLFMGIMFALALRREPSGWRRPVRISLVCLLVSVSFSIVFFANAFLHVLANLILANVSNPEDIELSSVLLAVARMGDPVLQEFLDFVLMSLACILSDWVVGKRWMSADENPLQNTFHSWLLYVVSIGFMLVATVSYVVVTEQELAQAKDTLRGEVNYLNLQLEEQRSRSELFANVSSQTKEVLSEEQQSVFINSYSIGSIIEGYTRRADGLVLITSGVGKDETILATNDGAFAIDKKLSEVFETETLNALQYSCDNNELMRTVYDRAFDTLDEDPSFDDIVAELGYLYAQKANNAAIIIMRPASMVFSNRTGITMWMTLAALVVLALVYALVSRLLGYVVVGPVAEVDDALDAICAGELETVVDAKGSLEMRRLSEGINTTVDTLKDLIADTERRMHQDLITAQTIQSSALPSTFPPFPDVCEFDIFASMDPAKEVGGDFYDFFMVDEHTLGFLIADVSGKGIPGALFMMAAKAELDNYMQTGMDLADAVQTANYRLCEGNDAGMFVTVWAAMLDYRRGVLTYVNAGHNPPLLRHKGSWTWLDKRSGLFMGTFEKAKYKSFELRLSPGDELLLYTDGVNEAFNVDDEEYGNDRLEEYLATRADLHPRELAEGLRESVAQWALGAEQSDDITILALEFGEAPMAQGQITVPAQIDRLGEIANLVDAELVQRLCPLGVQRKVNVALEELFINICRFAYADAQDGAVGECRVEYLYTTNPHSITVCLTDWGIPFDPLVESEVKSPMDAIENGGLGILMVRKSVDDISYMRDGDANVIAFTKRW